MQYDAKCTVLYEADFFKHNMVTVLYCKGLNKITGLHHSRIYYRTQEK